MTTPSSPAVAKDSKSLVADILADMTAAGHGAAAATEALAKEAAAAGRLRSAPAPAAPAVAPTGPVLTGGASFVIRPNGEKYFTRKMGLHDDVEVLRSARAANIPPLFYGNPGNGKTSLFEAAFTSDGFFYVPGSGDTEVSDFVGGYIPLPGGAFEWSPGPLPLAMEAGLPILIDEVALIEPKVMAVVYSVMDGRGELKITANPALKPVKSQPGFFVVGACNPNAPGARMSEALLSRFLLHVEMTVDFQLMIKMGVPRKLVTVVQNMEKKYKSNEIGWYPGMREMLGFKKVADVFGEATALSNVISQSPEDDRAQVAELMTRGFGTPIKTLEIR